MEKFIIQVIDNEIAGFGNITKSSVDGVEQEILNIEVTEDLFNAVLEDRQGFDPESGVEFVPKYIYSEGEIIPDPDYEQKQAQKEAERVGNLTMTALDFITFLRQSGLSLEAIRAYLDSNIELDTQLKYCQNVYCRVAKSVMPITLGDITITAEMVETAFKVKNGKL